MSFTSAQLRSAADIIDRGWSQGAYSRKRFWWHRRYCCLLQSLHDALDTVVLPGDLICEIDRILRVRSAEYRSLRAIALADENPDLQDAIASWNDSKLRSKAQVKGLLLYMADRQAKFEHFEQLRDEYDLSSLLDQPVQVDDRELALC